ncbi:hypothetical protein N7532_012095 [Penicillium argentinense]|uniref:Uncharacterized protein n=1 Tax=Penicillium argentinense TaxID=1131581 RepID=A0A9W9EJP1_9EURO|nr:uncharacterized protein N7532_012095 [Penicillium argentinense]KAJ5083052.1 hypothetical protein N7532_012095 [Penicillium argentinense]
MPSPSGSSPDPGRSEFSDPPWGSAGKLPFISLQSMCLPRHPGGSAANPCRSLQFPDSSISSGSRVGSKRGRENENESELRPNRSRQPWPFHGCGSTGGQHGADFLAVLST